MAFRAGAPAAARAEAAAEGTLLQALTRAREHSGYWLLNAGFFVCGFHVAFIATHLPSFLTDSGLSHMVGATALSLIGLANIFGSSLFGWLGDRYRKKYLLSALYFGRSIVIGLFLVGPPHRIHRPALWRPHRVFVAGHGAANQRHRSADIRLALFVDALRHRFFSHQIGSFLGVWLAGRLYDSTGSYDSVWWMAIALGLAATLLHLPIADRPLQTQAHQPQTV